MHKQTDSDRDFSSYQEYRSNFKKPFLLISARKVAADDLEVGLANRLSVLRFGELNYNAYAETVKFKNVSTLLTEPVLVVSYGKRLKATSQIGLAVPLTKPFKNNGETYPNVSALFQLGFIKYTIR